jgi:hypothetical protein
MSARHRPGDLAAVFAVADRRGAEQGAAFPAVVVQLGDLNCLLEENDSCDGPRITHERIVRVALGGHLSSLATLPPTTAPALIAQFWGVTLVSTGTEKCAAFGI